MSSPGIVVYDIQMMNEGGLVVGRYHSKCLFTLVQCNTFTTKENISDPIVNLMRIRTLPIKKSTGTVGYEFLK
jgi:hypothetical protein